MNKKYYTNERGPQIIIALLKAYGIRKIVASPGTTNLSLVASMQQDPFFEMYSSVDERSAAYMACGMAAESGEPVVITCTGATASRNYMPGLTEAFYRKLPVIALTANQGVQNIGHLIAQNIDRRQTPRDIVKMSVEVPVVKDDTDAWLCNVNVNKALLELTHHGGGPIHINFSTTYSGDFSVKELPSVRVINRITLKDNFPEISVQGNIGIFVGSHRKFTPVEVQAIDKFCEIHNAVVFCDHTSGYYGKYRVLYALVGAQSAPNVTKELDLLIHIGEVSGDYYGLGITPKEVWRVSEDGEVKDFFGKMRYIFEMPEEEFFFRYSKGEKQESTYLAKCKAEYQRIYDMIPELPFGNIWVAKQISKKLPANSVLHLGILNTLRSWNFFQVTDTVDTYCNVGGFGIDGIDSTVLGASLCNPNKLFFCVLGDLAFFYDLNAIANRHVRNNLRIMLINNGRGTEFTNFNHPGHAFGAAADLFIAAAGHYGHKSPTLVRHYAEDLGFKYLSASNKEEFLNVYSEYISPEEQPHPILFEVFTESKDESDALEMIHNLETAPKTIKQVVKEVVIDLLGDNTVKKIRKLI